jgi:hypothetical protein
MVASVTRINLTHIITNQIIVMFLMCNSKYEQSNSKNNGTLGDICPLLFAVLMAGIQDTSHQHAMSRLHTHFLYSNSSPNKGLERSQIPSC